MTRIVWTPEHTEKLRAMCAQGMTTAGMAKALGCGRSTVLRRIRADGIERVPPAGERKRQMTSPCVKYTVYKGEPPIVYAPGSLDFLKIPSRRGNRRFYRDGRIEEVEQ